MLLISRTVQAVQTDQNIFCFWTDCIGNDRLSTLWSDRVNAKPGVFFAHICKC